MRLCCKCKTETDPQQKLHRFPENSEEAMEWATLLNWVDGYNKKKAEGTQNRSIFVCSKHFAKSGVRRNSAGSVRKGYNQRPFDHHEILLRPPILDRFDSMDTDSNLSNNDNNSFTSPSEPVKIIDQFINCKMENETGLCLIDMSQLKELLKHIGCLKCGDKTILKEISREAAVAVVKTICNKCKINEWSSTKMLQKENSKGKGIYTGNLDVTTGIVLSAIDYEVFPSNCIYATIQRFRDFARIIDLHIPSESTHYRQRKNLIAPEIGVKYDEMMEKTYSIVEEKNEDPITKISEVVLAGDGQYDSRGFSAQYCRYSLFDVKTRLILGYDIVNKEETESMKVDKPDFFSSDIATRMERLACVRALKKFEEASGLHIAEFVIDYSKSVLAKLKNELPEIYIKTLLDKWHILKNIQNNVREQLKGKTIQSLVKLHWQSFLTHIWMCISWANGNGDAAVEMIQSSLYHLRGIHKFPGKYKYISECFHCENGTHKKPLDLTQKADLMFYKIIEQIVTDAKILEGIRKCSADNTTTCIELFHSLVAQIYLPKNNFYGEKGMTMRFKLACLHHNNHRFEILEDEEHKEAQDIPMPKKQRRSNAQGRVTSVRKNVAPSNVWKIELLEDIRERYLNGEEVILAADLHDDEWEENFFKKFLITTVMKK